MDFLKIYPNKELSRKKIESVIVICVLKKEETDLDEKAPYIIWFPIVFENKQLKNVFSPRWVETEDALWLYWLEGRDGKILIKTHFFIKDKKGKFLFPERINQEVIPFYKEYGFSVPKKFRGLITNNLAFLFVIGDQKIYQYNREEYSFKKITDTKFRDDAVGEVIDNKLLVVGKEGIIELDPETKEMRLLIPQVEFFSKAEE